MSKYTEVIQLVKDDGNWAYCNSGLLYLSYDELNRVNLDDRDENPSPVFKVAKEDNYLYR